jgi:hypothetical protein
MGRSGAYPRTMVVRGNAGGRYGPQRRGHAADYRDRRSGDPRCGIRDGVSGHMARGCARAFRKRSPRHPCDPRRRLPPSWAPEMQESTVR